MYVVSSVSGGGDVDYGLQTASGGLRYVVDASGTPLNITLTPLCPTGSYPGPPSTIASASGDSAITRPCVTCPSLTSTFGPALSKEDCRCEAGLVDARAFLPPGVSVDPAISPCVSSAVFCAASSEAPVCATFRLGTLGVVNPGYWMYADAWALLPPAGAGPLLTDMYGLRAATLVHKCSGGNCAGNATGSAGSGCSPGSVGPMCLACAAGYHMTSGYCLACFKVREGDGRAAGCCCAPSTVSRTNRCFTSFLPGACRGSRARALF